MTTTGIEAVDFYGYILTSPLGFLGHTCSLITFSSKTLRLTSIGFLFIVLTISDILYLLILMRDFLQNFNFEMLKSEDVCRFSSFILNFSSMTSAWILVLIAIDRFLRVRFPFQHARLCTRKMASYMIIIVCICATLFTCHVLQQEFAFTNRLINWCGPARSPPTSYSVFYFNTWPLLQLIFTYILPGVLMIILLIEVYTKIRVPQTIIGVASTRREKHQRQMLILMISSVTCFVICTLPYGIFRVISARIGWSPSVLLVTNILEILLNMNYCYNFYIHCLTSQLFRKTFIQQIKRATMWFKRQIRQDNNTIHPLPAIVRAQELQATNASNN